MRLDSSASFVDRLLGYPCDRLGVCFCSGPCPTIEVILNERNPLRMRHNSAPRGHFVPPTSFPSNQSFVKSLKAYAKRLDIV